MQQQFKFIVKKLFVERYGWLLQHVWSGLATNTLNVQQFPSSFSTLNTFEHSAQELSNEVFEQVQVTSLLVGILIGTPLPQHV